jgi:hypothetical protein
MTAKRDLKKRVRARQARTGERYTTALQHVTADRPGGGDRVPVVELVDLSAQAAEAGLTGRIVMFPELAERIDPAAGLRRLHDVLVGTRADPAMEAFRAILLEGRDPKSVPRPTGGLGLQGIKRFLDRARAGIGGVSDGALILALPVQGREKLETVLCLLWGVAITHAAHFLVRVGGGVSAVLLSADTEFGIGPEVSLALIP